MISTSGSERFKRLADIFYRIKAETDSALRQNRPKVFVSNNATKAIRDLDKFIFVGRKGSGKTALVYDYVESTKSEYNIHLTIEKDKAPHWHLYNFYYKQFAEAESKVIERLKKLSNQRFLSNQARDIKEIFDPVSLFRMAWTGAIQVCIIDAIVNDETHFGPDQFLEQRAALRKFLFDKFGVSDDPSTRISETIDVVITSVCEIIQSKIEEFIDANVPSLGVLLSRIAKWAAGEPTSRIISEEADKFIRQLLRDSQVRVLVSMDKYDDLVDELIAEINNMRDIQERFPKNAASPDLQNAVRLSMLSLQKNMLKGLLLASRSLREDPDYRNVHFALAVPDDRYAELELREGANLNLAHVQKISWTPLELTEFFVRRCAAVLDEEGIQIDIDIKDAKQLQNSYLKVMRHLGLPEKIPHRRLKSVKEDFIFYVIRHTLNRPRDLLRYFNGIFSAVGNFLEQNQELSEEQFENICRATIRRVSQEIITDELLVEYKAEYQGLDNILSKFVNRGSEIDSKMLLEILDTRLILAEEKMTKVELAERLYRLGLFGVRISRTDYFDGSIRALGKYTAFRFSYDDNHGRSSVGRKQDFLNLQRHGEGAIWVIHPMFYDHLRIQTNQNYVVNYMDWESVISRHASDYRPGKSHS